MFKTLFAATALLAMTTAPAFAKDGVTRTFTRDGETYSYTTVNQGNRILIRGMRRSNGSIFELAVRGSQVTGVSGGIPVSFKVPDAQAKLTSTEVAAR